jgi:type I restriction enzyme M protein
LKKNNPSLKGALPDNYYSRLGLDASELASLLDTIHNIDTIKDKQHDIVGRVYEYFLSKFALAEGKGKGEFYTPKSIVNLIAEMIEPYKGKIYDPCCGSGGMFVQSIKFIQAHHGNIYLIHNNDSCLFSFYVYPDEADNNFIGDGFD